MTPEQEAHIESQQTRILELLTAYGGAFPQTPLGGPDLVGHRGYHDDIIETLRARREFWQKMSFELTKWGLIGFLGWFTVVVLWPATIGALLKGHP